MLMFTLESVISTPSNVILPPVGISRRFKQRRKVDLPLPEGPIITITYPCPTCNVIPSTAFILPF